MNPNNAQVTGGGLPPPTYSPNPLSAPPQLSADASYMDATQPYIPPLNVGDSPMPQHKDIEPSNPQAQADKQSSIDEDSGALDQEWVEKAKEVIARNRNDPYSQSQEISKLKAQYIKARYNKDIKIMDD